MITALVGSFEDNFAVFKYWSLAGMLAEFNAKGVVIHNFTMHLAGLAMDASILV
jgi:hypothetical protein